jgi:hypothetical protein
MEASTIKDVVSPPVDAQRRRVALTRLLRMGVSDGDKSSSGDALAMGELETELALLREENAQLKVERHRPADVGHVIERMRSLRLQTSGATVGESAAPGEELQTIAACLAMREGLMEACQEAQQAMQGIRAKLGALAGDIHSRVEAPLAAEPRPSARLEPLAHDPEQAGSTPELVQSVA